MRRVTRVHLFVAFTFTVMADPISSVAYAIEAALGRLDGNLAALFPTMALVVATIIVVAATYHQLIRRFPQGGGGAEAMAAAFGEGWAFVPLAALIVDFTLTVAISAAAGASAIIAYLPDLAGSRLTLALGLMAIVAGGIAFGHRGRVAFAVATQLFLAAALVVILLGVGGDPVAGTHPPPLVGGDEGVAILLAMPLGMALATGVESPSNAIGQLSQLSDRGRRIFGQLTLWTMVAIVGGLTLCVSALAVGLGVGAPPEDSTLLAEVARQATGGGAAFGVFQAVSALLLLAAAASAYAAASGLLRALALHGADGGGLLPTQFAARNRHLVPYWGVVAILATSAVVILISGGRDQAIVDYYAVAVFLSFLGALAGCARLSQREGRSAALVVNVAGLLLVGFVLALNLQRIGGLVSMAATAAIALALWAAWMARGRPAGVARAGAGAS